MTTRDDDRGELGRALRVLRTTARLTQVDVIARTGVSQARLSRIEQGKSLPREKDLAELLSLYRATPEDRGRVLDLARETAAGIQDERLVVQRGHTMAMQQRWRRLETESRLMRSFHPSVVLGVLQTADYASVILDDPAAVADRLQRHHALLTRTSTRYVLIQTEGALRYRVGSADVMRTQLAAIEAASRRPNVEFGVVPARQAVRVVPTGGFHLYDDHTVTVGLHVAAATLTEPADLAVFEELFTKLSEAAVWGDQARDELRRIVRDTH